MIHLLRRLFGLTGRASRRAAASADAGPGIRADEAQPVFRPLDEIREETARAPASVPGFGLRRGPAETRLAEAFTPTQPRSLGPLFIGRDAHLRRMITAVEDERAHIVLFGERGRGKTSLANGFATLAEEAGLLTVRRPCGTGTTYEKLFRGLFAEIPGHRLAGAGSAATAAELLPDGDFGAEEVCAILARLQGGRVVLVVDEFDRAESDRLRSEIAETIKNLSDDASAATLLLVGVAASLEDLLGRQPSIQRAILAMPLPPMSEADVAKLVTAGAEAAGVDFAPEAVALIVRLSRGMPYYAHLLCLYAARAVEADGGGRPIGRDDVLRAAAEAMQKQAAELEAAWSRATAAPDAEATILAVALAPFDEDGRVALADLPAELHPGVEALSAEETGPVLLRRDGPQGVRLAFPLPAIAHQALLRAACAGRLPDGAFPSARPPAAPAGGQQDSASIAA